MMGMTEFKSDIQDFGYFFVLSKHVYAAKKNFQISVNHVVKKSF